MAGCREEREAVLKRLRGANPFHIGEAGAVFDRKTRTDGKVKSIYFAGTHRTDKHSVLFDERRCSIFVRCRIKPVAAFFLLQSQLTTVLETLIAVA